MNWDQVQGEWQYYRGLVRQRWVALTEDDLSAIHGRRDLLAAKLVISCGRTKEEAEKEIAAFEASCGSRDPAKPRGDEAEGTDAV